MRLLLEIGYEKLILSESANVAAVIDALSRATPVTCEGYGSEAKYLSKSKWTCSLRPEYVHESQIISEEASEEIISKTLKEANDKLQSEKYTLAQELKELKEKVNGLTEN